MPDPARPSPTLSDIDQELYRLTLAEVQARFTDAGMPRSYRSIQRYCEHGRLDCLKTDTPNGEQYFVSEASVTRAIEELRQLWALKHLDGHDRQDPAIAGHVVPASPTIEHHDTPGHRPTVSDAAAPQPTPAIEKAGEPQPVVPGQTQTTDAAMSKYVARLERDNDRLEQELDVKNEQIAALLERDRETNVLVGSLQRLLAPAIALLGAPDPHRGAVHEAEHRDVQDQR